MKIDTRIEEQYLVDSYGNEIVVNGNSTPYYIMTGKHKYYSYAMDYVDVTVTKECLERHFDPVDNLINVIYVNSSKTFWDYVCIYKHKNSDTFIHISPDLSKEGTWDEANEDIVYKENYFKVFRLFYKLDNIDLGKDLEFYSKNLNFGVEKETTINLVLKTMSGFKFKEFNITPYQIDLDKHYNDDFKSVHNSIVYNLNKSKKGIIMLHGMAGTGKTNYIKYLTGVVKKKKFVFIPTTMIGSLSDPSFIENLIDNSNSILVLEDCEIYLQDRKLNSGNNNFVSTLLNISDGILSDVLDIQVICTFNNDLKAIDPALLRDGRLIAEYKFGTLEINKARRLVKEVGADFESLDTSNLTLAGIYNANKGTAKVQKEPQKIGFK